MELVIESNSKLKYARKKILVLKSSNFFYLFLITDYRSICANHFLFHLFLRSLDSIREIEKPVPTLASDQELDILKAKFYGSVKFCEPSFYLSKSGICVSIFMNYLLINDLSLFIYFWNIFFQLLMGSYWFWIGYFVLSSFGGYYLYFCAKSGSGKNKEKKNGEKLGEKTTSSKASILSQKTESTDSFFDSKNENEEEINQGTFFYYY